jgi:hypothetical protein
MARKLKQSENSKDGGASEVAHLANFQGFDGEKLKEHVAEVVKLADKAKDDAQPVKDHKALIKGEFGYNMKGFGLCIQMERADLVEARDIWLTVKAYAKVKGLDDPDLVEQMEAA